MNITRVQMRDAGKLAGATVAGIEMIETIKASGAEGLGIAGQSEMHEDCYRAKALYHQTVRQDPGA